MTAKERALSVARAYVNHDAGKMADLERVIFDAILEAYDAGRKAGIEEGCEARALEARALHARIVETRKESER